MPDPDDKAQMQALTTRLDEAWKKQRGRLAPPPLAAASSAYSRAGMELVAALAFGTGVGWALDWGLGSKPWGLIIGFFLGAAAGMVGLFRAMRDPGRDPNRDP
ncbi:AtpZ/AtpI family protein [Nitrospirillum iridis]|uniref:ATP synthase protein I n=1 Tax=Nitrospirillum iridis TaxID=765888 RepID=A0A7X0ECG8_9PROT|nr:AtpZ/AtpI family protein [Nitrospirillum iridis]MBB6251100.1 ATP synthase protein I [Nitrospirillum iridis]